MIQDRREKIQDMLLERIKELIAQYDIDKDTSPVEDNVTVLRSIAELLAADALLCESTCPCCKIGRGSASKERLPPPPPTPMPGNGRPR